MRPFSLRSARFALSAFGFGPMLLGCFDVEQVAVPEESARPSPRLIDNFDDDFDNSERQPVDPSFEPWRCFGVNGAVLNVRCDAGEGSQRQGRLLKFDLLDVPDGSRDYQGIELQTRAREAVDFSAYERFVFSAALYADSMPSSVPVLAALYCGDLVDGGVMQSKNHLLEAGAAFRACPVDMGEFHQPDWQREQWQADQRQPLDEAACLAGVLGVGIYVQPDMPDGRSAAGTVSVDDIYAQ